MEDYLFAIALVYKAVCFSVYPIPIADGLGNPGLEDLDFQEKFIYVVLMGSWKLDAVEVYICEMARSVECF